jgi:hypothetical protein
MRFPAARCTNQGKAGFTFQGGTLNTQKNSNGVIRISGNCHLFRLDHCTFDHLQGTSLAVAGFLWGVIDHNLFNCVTKHPIIVKHREWNGRDWGHGSWADNPYWGSEKFVFIEDNIFENAGDIDSFEGARFVVRHNHMHNFALVMYGTEGQGGVARSRSRNTTTPDQKRGIITHDNTWTNVAKGKVLNLETGQGSIKESRDFFNNTPNQDTNPSPIFTLSSAVTRTCTPPQQGAELR